MDDKQLVINGQIVPPDWRSEIRALLVEIGRLEACVTPAALKAGFWSALDGIESGPYIGTAANGDAELIDGNLPESLWTRMAAELSKTDR